MHSHGGFFVRSLDPHHAEPIRLAVKAALLARSRDPRKLHLGFAAVRDCPVMHVAIYDHLADPRDEAALHRDHLDIAGDIARAAAADVWAYHCPHGVGVEIVQHFAADGGADRARTAHHVAGVGLATSGLAAASPSGLAAASPSGLAATSPSGRYAPAAASPSGRYAPAAASARAEAEPLPLHQLAATLGVSRELLEVLATARARIDVALATSGPCTEAVATYLSGALRPPVVLSPPDRKLAPSDIEESLYFPGWMGEELVALAQRLRLNLGTLVWAAWEAAKPRLYQATPLFDDYPAEGSLPPAPRVRPPPPSKPPPKLALPTDAPLLPRPVDARDKVMLTLVLPARVRDELGSFAVGADKPVSWIVQQAILLVRHRLLGAATR